MQVIFAVLSRICVYWGGGNRLEMYYKLSFDFLLCISSFILSSYITLTRIKML
jgi:hypothetical protein